MADLTLHQADGHFDHSVVEAFLHPTAVLDHGGTIRAVNAAWKRFAYNNGHPRERSFETNYLVICDHCRSELLDADSAYHGISRVLRGELDKYELIYPCHSPTTRRWFLMTVVPLPTVRGELWGVVTHVDISQQKILEEEVMAFSALAAHDLQAPLRNIGGFARLIGRKYGDRLDGKARELFELIVKGTDRMKALLDDLLLYARADGKPLRLSEVATRTLVLDILDEFTGLVAETRAEIRVGELPTLRADHTLLSHVFRNLVDNALKYRRPEQPPQLEISAERQPGNLLFSVSDNGIGIRPEYQERIFLPFTRLHAETEYSGTGLGLGLCQKIIERHGGRIWASQRPSGGTCFYFTIPETIENQRPVENPVRPDIGS